MSADDKRDAGHTVPDMCIQGGNALVVYSLYCGRLSSALCSFMLMSVNQTAKIHHVSCMNKVLFY